MFNSIPEYAFKQTKVVRRVWDNDRKTMIDVDEDEVASVKPHHVSYDVSVTNDILDDPMVAVMLLAHLRTILGGPDIERVSVEVDYRFTGLSKDQLATLYSFMEMSWSGLNVNVTEERRIYDRSDDMPPLRRDEAA